MCKRSRHSYTDMRHGSVRSATVFLDGGQSCMPIIGWIAVRNQITCQLYVCMYVCMCIQETWFVLEFAGFCALFLAFPGFCHYSAVIRLHRSFAPTPRC